MKLSFRWCRADMERLLEGYLSFMRSYRCRCVVDAGLCVVASGLSHFPILDMRVEITHNVFFLPVALLSSFICSLVT
jgi:hypothetical protein